MMRNFGSSKDSSMSKVQEILFEFDLPSATATQFSLLRYECISPDSFMWRITDGLSVYYLYAEDYIPGVNHVKKVFTAYLESDNWEFVSATEAIPFNKASPVVSANTYQEPKESDQLIRYGLGSGHDFVFLVRSNEKVEDCLFSDSAPRGFQV